MIVFPEINLAFLHVPKVAGTYVRRAVRWLGEVEHESMTGRLEHADREMLDWVFPNRRLDHFCIVRHPAEWLRSYWCDRMTKGWGGDLMIAHSREEGGCASDDFNQFALNVAQDYPGIIGDLFRRYTRPGKDGGRARVFRHEDVSAGEVLLTALEEAGAKLSSSSRNALLAGGRHVNESDPKLKNRAVYRPEVLAELLYREREIIDQFWPEPRFPRQSTDPTPEARACVHDRCYGPVIEGTDPVQRRWVCRHCRISGRTVAGLVRIEEEEFHRLRQEKARGEP